MLSNRNFFFYSRILIDIIAIVISYWLTYLIIPFSIVFKTSTNFLYLLLIFQIVLWLFTSFIFNTYDEFRSRNFSYELVTILKSVFVQPFSVILIVFVIKETIPRYFTFVYPTLLFIIISCEKFILRQFLYKLRRKGRNLRSLLIVGAGKMGDIFYEEVISNPHFGYVLIGFIDDIKKESFNGQYLGKIGDLSKVLSERKVDDVIIALPNYEINKIEETIQVCENFTTRVKVIPDYFNFASKYETSMFGKFPIIAVHKDTINEYHWRFIKRAYDFLLTILVFVIVFWWLWPLIAVLIKITSKGPVFYKQERWGRNNKRISCFKFRTMTTQSRDLDENGVYKQATKDDPRVTKIGKLLRRTNLDELPQFLNVLNGDMSIVGPRPHPTPLNIQSKDKVKRYMLRTLVKPGITGWAQVNGFRGETKELDKMQKRVDYDLWYMENWSVYLDIQIMVLTVWYMFKGDPNAY